MNGSNKESKKLTRLFLIIASSIFSSKSARSSFSCPNVLMTLIPVILSCVLSLILEKASCESRKASWSFDPSTREVMASKGRGISAISVKRQSINKIIAMIVVPPVITESAKVKIPAPATFWIAFKSFVA